MGSYLLLVPSLIPRFRYLFINNSKLDKLVKMQTSPQSIEEQTSKQGLAGSFLSNRTHYKETWALHIVMKTLRTTWFSI